MDTHNDELKMDIGDAVRMNMATLPKPPPATIRHLSVLAYAQGFTHWLYKQPTGSVFVAPDYFKAAGFDILNPGDVVLMTTTFPVQAASYVVGPQGLVYLMGG